MGLSRFVWTGVALAIVAGCGGSGDGDAGTAPAVTVTVEAAGTTDVPESAEPSEATSDDSAASVPTVTFEEVKLEEGLVAPVPVGWEPDEFLEWEFQPPEGSGFDPSPPSYWVSLQCAGSCEVRTSGQWAAAVEQSLYSLYRHPEGYEIVRDEVGEHGALLETNHFGWIDVQIARWVGGQDHIVTCHISLYEDHAELLADFEAACLAAESPVLVAG